MLRRWPPKRTTTSKQDIGQAKGFRSGLEEKAAAQLLAAKIDPAYETFVVPYVIPERNAKYTADFRLPNGIVIETKGRFVTEDRKKHKLIREQHPELDIRIVFMRPNATISKTSKTTYAKWCDDHGVKWAKMHSRENPIPPEWLAE
jgi:hypothetical protein